MHLYFNRFVSNDGRTLDDPDGGLKETDFIPETGEPRLTQEVYDKLTALGELHCENQKVRRGATFGHFNAEPNPGYYIHYNTAEADHRFYSIIDDIFDSDPDNQSGFNEFQKGLRWSHHIYCE